MYKKLYWFFSKLKNSLKTMPSLAISMEKDTYTNKNLETKNQILINS